MIPEGDDNRVYDHDKNRPPVHVHIHKETNGSDKTEHKNKEAGKKGTQKKETHVRDEGSDESNESDETDGSSAVVGGGKLHSKDFMPRKYVVTS